MADHAHHHHATPSPDRLNGAFRLGIGLNLAYVLIQIGVGWRIGSLSLLSDAGHNFLDVAGLALSLLAYRLAAVKPTDRYTYGYRKASVLISLVNAVTLLVSVGVIGYEAVLRFGRPEPLPGLTLAVVAGVGIVVNGVSALFFLRDKAHDLNVRSAFLHLASDALVSAGLVVGGIVIHYTGLFWIDPALSLLVCAVILVSTWSLLRESLRLSLDGVPDGVDLARIRREVGQLGGVVDFRHVHVWALSTNQNALTGYVVVGSETGPAETDRLRARVKHTLTHLNIQHSTIEIERGGQPSDEPTDC
jgi:cobalt-zinc-cadmium efflux system protein